METLPVQREDGIIRMSGELTMHHAEQLAPLLLASLPTDGSVAQLDLTDVSEIDTAGLQLLMAAHRETLQRCTSLTIVAASQVVRDTLELFRQAGLLGSSPPPKPARKSRKPKAARKS
jgi:anti-sigma B factor antagonist